MWFPNSRKLIHLISYHLRVAVIFSMRMGESNHCVKFSPGHCNDCHEVEV